MSFEDAIRRIAEKQRVEARAEARARALAEQARIAALSPRERLRDFIIAQTYSHDMPAEADPDASWGFREISQDKYPAVVDREIDAFKAEVLRGAAAKIREYADSDGLDYYSPQGLRDAADLIDPDKDTE